MKLTEFSKRLQYQFSAAGLLEAALTHRSAGNNHNERLEFLGDAVLDLVISEELYRIAPQASEGDLSRLRASLVRRESLATVATSLGLGDHLRLGSGEQRSGGHRRQSTLADALEAVLGAVYLDGGLDAARHCVQAWFGERLADLPDPAALRDPKTRLQERLQARGAARPEYQLVRSWGDAHARQFEVACRISEPPIETFGIGTSRRRAEQQAAEAALDQVGRGHA